MNLPTRLFIFLFVSITLNGFSQSKTIKERVYFDSGSDVIRTTEKEKINRLIAKLDTVIVSKIYVKGHTDTDGDSIYNINLSSDRTGAVIKHLESNGLKNSYFVLGHYGEDKPTSKNTTEEGRSKNRRVDITVLYKPNLNSKPILVDSVINPDLVVEKDSCSGDTTIYLEGGTLMVFNKCEFTEKYKCLDIVETVSAESIMETGQSTMSSNGLPLSSCGMISIGMKPGCKEECFDKPVVIRFPVPIDKECDACGRSAGLFTVTNDGTWEPIVARGKKIKTVRYNGVMYFEFSIVCPIAGINCDCPCIAENKVKFKVPKPFKIESVSVGYECPMTVIKNLNLGEESKNKIVLYLPCYQTPKWVMATITNETGDTLVLERQLLNELKHRNLFPRCGKMKPKELDYKWLGIIPLRKKDLYRKYFINPEALKKQ